MLGVEEVTMPLVHGLLYPRPEVLEGAGSDGVKMPILPEAHFGAIRIGLAQNLHIFAPKKRPPAHYQQCYAEARKHAPTSNWGARPNSKCNNSGTVRARVLKFCSCTKGT